jgi:pyruvate dehydrogenase E1 component alpha subunit
MGANRDLLVEMLRRMLLIRRFEEEVVELANGGKILGSVHPYIGEEAVAVGACLALRDDDYITGNHRSHGHPIAKGADIKKAMAEIMGKKTGYCKGKGGSMHLADFSVGILGESGIVASSLPVAVGAAYASKIRKMDRVAICFFGDGASNQGAFHESLNLAALWKLPVIFLCENNQYGQLTSVRNAVSVENISDRASAYGVPGLLVDGQDVIAMYEVVNDAVQRARAGEGPSLVEGKTYRYHDHSVSLGKILPKPYRSQEEVEAWMKRDPIDIHTQYLLENRVMREEEVQQMDEKIIAQVREATQFAEESPFPDADDLYEDMYANPISVR